MKYVLMTMSAALLAACAGAPQPLCDRSTLVTEKYASHVDAYCEAKEAPAGWQPDGGYADEGTVGGGSGPDVGHSDPVGSVGVPGSGDPDDGPDAPDAGPDGPVGEDPGDGKDDNGHGNDPGGYDPSNPGNSDGAPGKADKD